MKTLFAAVLAALVAASPLLAAEMTKGEVTKVDTRRNRVTIKHEELKNLDMPAMTMVFEVADPAMIERLSVGKSVTFTADRVKGKLTVTELK